MFADSLKPSIFNVVNTKIKSVISDNAPTVLCGCEGHISHTPPRTIVPESAIDIAPTSDYRIHEHAAAISRIKAFLKNESFWTMYVVKKSPADGHCFMHSLVSCINSRMTTMTPCDNRTLFKHLRSEIVTNSAYYLSLIKGGTYSDLHAGMEMYICYRQYRTGFGDLVPYIMANALNMNIFIIELFHGEYMVKRIFPRESASDTTRLYSGDIRDIFLFKTEEHYDACVATRHGGKDDKIHNLRPNLKIGLTEVTPGQTSPPAVTPGQASLTVNCPSGNDRNHQRLHDMSLEWQLQGHG